MKECNPTNRKKLNEKDQGETEQKKEFFCERDFLRDKITKNTRKPLSR